MRLSPLHTILLPCLFSLFTLAPGGAFCQSSDQAATLEVKGEVTTPLVLHQTDLAPMRRLETRAKDHDGKEHNFSGVPLADLLQKAGAPMGSQLRGKNMTKFLLVRSRDGYQTIFALAELDSAFTDRVILLADRMDGNPFPPEKGPFQVIVPGEKKHARWNWGVITLIVGSAKE